ncbi:MAG: DUF6377 domain-containing protein [Prevotella sp.]|nr:DUF6377 domain-containing protein [Bacteroides sp.]MCM1366979.1 DUF6377 domain-containing protein [Prevotella sp.]MCM1437488.1 DUF6377 domain-containing protein [Prevotella sp.]
MKNSILILSITYFLAAFSIKAESHNAIPYNDLQELNQAISNAPLYTARINSKIDSLRINLYNIPSYDIQHRLDLTLRICDIYRPFNTDSSLNYAVAAGELLKSAPLSNQSLNANYNFRCRLALMNALSTAGIFSSAISIYEEIKQMTLSPSQKIEFWKGARLLYSYMQTYVANDSHFYAEYAGYYQAYDDSLLNALPRKDKFYKFIKAEKLIRYNQLNEAESLLLAMIKSLKTSDNLYGMAAYQLAEVYKKRDNENLFASFLTKAAISDIKGCIREGLALPILAQWLYTKGLTNEAFRYINYSLSEANAGNARMRAVAIASFMPVIDSAYREKILSTNKKLTFTAIFTCIISIITIILLILLFRYMRVARQINTRLSSTAAVQENYIGHFIALCASYAGKLDSLTQLVSRKITSGQSEELLKLVKSGRFAEQQNDDFYNIFDSAFLEIYPHFIEEINLLLRPDSQFRADSTVLTPELRIYALVRLGINESTRISQILHYSVSTIYAYRNRMRNRAINRDSFEKDIMQIGQITLKYQLKTP